METKHKHSQNSKVIIELENKNNSQVESNTFSTTKKTITKDFLLRKKAMYGERFCLLTGEKFIPLRSSQKFANPQNRMEYYNNLTNLANREIINSVKSERLKNEQTLLWTQILSFLEENKSVHFSKNIKKLTTKYILKTK